jgi:hypothetical protein
MNESTWTLKYIGKRILFRKIKENIEVSPKKVGQKRILLDIGDIVRVISLTDWRLDCIVRKNGELHDVTLDYHWTRGLRGEEKALAKVLYG